MKRFLLSACAALSAWVVCFPLLPAHAEPDGGSGWRVIAWNDLGMHCTDPTFEVFSLLPPFNDLVAQVVDPSGHPVGPGAGIEVTYRAVADPTGSINRTSVGKTDFWDHVQELFGVAPPPDTGLAGYSMPGPANVPQPLEYDPVNRWFQAPGIPLTPYDDAGRKNTYPMMRVEVRDAQGTLLAQTDVVLPVSDEMDCRVCHSSGATPDARPSGGWALDPDPVRDYRLNILLLHDDREGGNPAYQAALAAGGFDPQGLAATVLQGGRAVLCAACHASNALPGTGQPGISALTAAVHGGHAAVADPVSGTTLDAADNRSACYRCHPGSETRCLRGAMGAAVAADGSLAMQCQSCHGSMSSVGDPARVGWLEEPACQNCHTGTATHNNGQIRYTTVFEPNGQLRVAVDDTFATTPDQPAQGFSLYRFSSGHGELACSACHGSPHAIYASIHPNDNVQNEALQGHAGTLSECTACHAGSPNTVAGGPHGMHPVGQPWVEGHEHPAEHGGIDQCKACHGSDLRGTVLSRSLADRTLNTDFGPKHFWKGFQIGCYACHDGPDDEHANSNHAPIVQDAQIVTPAGVPASVTLVGTDPDGTMPELRIVSQPSHGTVGLVGHTATWYPEAGFAGDDAFTYAAWDGETQSELGTVQLRATANWVSFGGGHPGTLGVPGLTAGAVPSLGSLVPIDLENSAGFATVAFLAVGSRPDYQPTPWGGELLVAEPSYRVLSLGPGGFHRALRVPSDPAVIGRNLVLQGLVRDPGASGGIAFSRGLRLVMGL